MTEGVRIVIVLPGLVGARRTTRLVSIAVPYRHVRSTFSVTHARLIILTFLNRMFKDIRSRRVVIIAVFTRRRRSNKSTNTRRSIHKRTSSNLGIIILRRIPTGDTFLAAARRRTVKRCSNRSTIITRVMRIVRRRNMIHLKLKHSTMFRTSVLTNLQQFPVLKMKEVQSRDIRRRQLVNLVLNLINIRPQPIAFRYISITNRSIIQRSTTRSGIRTHRIMNILLRFLHMVPSIVQITITANRHLTSISRRQAQATYKIVSISFLATNRVPNRSFTRRL